LELSFPLLVVDCKLALWQLQCFVWHALSLKSAQGAFLRVFHSSKLKYHLPTLGVHRRHAWYFTLPYARPNSLNRILRDDDERWHCDFSVYRGRFLLCERPADPKSSSGFRRSLVVLTLVRQFLFARVPKTVKVDFIRINCKTFVTETTQSIQKGSQRRGLSSSYTTLSRYHQ
jgi:hypothetical protein